MSDRVDHRDHLSAESHLTNRPIEPDQSNRLDEEPARAGEFVGEEEEDAREYSVSDEPALGWAKIDREAAPGYAELLAERRRDTTRSRQWTVALLAALAAGPMAILGVFVKALIGGSGWGYMAVVVIGPVIEEMMKVAAILWVVERRPWLAPGGGAILLVGAAGGLGFAAIENVLYLRVYFEDHTAALATWRWTVCVVMHAGCSLIAALGVRHMYQDTLRTGRPAIVSRAFPYLVAAMVIHGGYNGLAVVLSIFEVTPAF